MTMPPLPPSQDTAEIGCWVAYRADQMHAYARAYAEQETARVRDDLGASLAYYKSMLDEKIRQRATAEQETAALQKELGECSGGYQTLEREVAALTAETAALRAALQELVDCKDLIDSIPDNWQTTEIERHEILGPRYAEYKRRKPLAWEAARKAIK